MSAIDIVSLQGLVNSMSNLNSTVLWIRDSDCTKQLFVSDSVYDVYGFTSEMVYEYPEIWSSKIVDQYLEHTKLRNYERVLNIKNNIADYEPIYYEILTDDGRRHHLKNTCFPILSGRQLLGVYGFTEKLEPEHWQMLRLTKSGYTSKKLGSEISTKLAKDLIKDVNRNSRNESYTINPENLTMSQKLLWNKLSSREKQCVEQLILGRSAKETGRILGLSSRTVESYIESIKTKFGCYKKIEIVTKFK